MSKFSTAIKVDIRPVLEALPAGAYVDGIVWNPAAEQIEVLWDHAPLRTGLDHAVDYPVDWLREGKAPGALRQAPSASARTPEPKALAPARARRKSHDQ